MTHVPETGAGKKGVDLWHVCHCHGY